MQEYVEELITREALNPPIIHDQEKLGASMIELFNNGAKALEAGFKHRLGPFSRFGLRLEQTVRGVPGRDQHGHPTIIPRKRIVLRQLFPNAIGHALILLGTAIREKRTFEYTGPNTPHRLLTKSQLSNIKAEREWLALSLKEKAKWAQEALAKKEGYVPSDTGQAETHKPSEFLPIVTTAITTIKLRCKDEPHRRLDCAESIAFPVGR